MKTKHKVQIIVAIFSLVEAVVVAIIAARWGQAQPIIIVNQFGEEVALDNNDIQLMASEYENLKIKDSDYESKGKEVESELSNQKKQIENLENDKKVLETELEALNKKLNEVPVIEFKNCGLSVNGDEKIINKDKSYVEINGRQYYSRDCIESLLPDNMILTMKDETLFIGKIIKEKTSLFNLVQIKNSGYKKLDNIIDTFGNSYSSILYFPKSGSGVTYNAERLFSNFKCIVAMKEGSGSYGYIQIETDDPEYTYISQEITNLTECFEIDIPINYTSTITIKSVNGSYYSNIFISNPTLYNQE